MTSMSGSARREAANGRVGRGEDKAFERFVTTLGMDVSQEMVAGTPMRIVAAT
ncbi:hypothetical protein N5079_34535 [Planotetraspora sp. A-T 1434]|uniref:hypothetical protein n=1 Tax=Planotetraspora sp. A-T 1434 TaxID=2979219 RepID=UPI0021BF7FB9|nr:hypothetical protein [Planotetraspora sp. A-T 1434]MCT9935334.1 hypothetical protein [Planotetraspora sp. A-T 1434]